MAAAPPPKTRRGLFVGCLVATLLLAVAIVAGGLVGAYLFKRIQPGSASAGVPTPAQSVPERAACDARAGQLVQALQAGDAQAASAAVYPDMRKALQGLVQSDPAAARRLAELLAGRKPASYGRRLIEYEVIDGGRKRHVAFQKVGEEWLLVSF